MTDLVITSGPNGLQAVDSLTANEFVFLINDEPVSGLFRVTGLVTFKLEVKTTTSKKQVYEPFKITKMVQKDGHNSFNKWIRETTQARGDIVRPMRTLTLVAMDEGQPTRRWVVRDAWISEISYSDFDTASGDLVQEVLNIQHSGIDESWPSTE